VIGQGLAGTTLAWQFFRRGFRVLVMERETGHSSSRIAAGLITPVTGKRLAKSWRLEEVYPAAVAFYREIESRTSATVLAPHPAFRIFQDAAELAEFGKRAPGMLAGLVRLASSPPNAAWFEAPLGGFEMPTAARLDVSRYLEVSRAFFQQNDCYLHANLEFAHDVQVGNDEIVLPRFNVRSRAVILCRGFDLGSDPWFGGIRFNAAKGEILTLRIPELREERTFHRGIWLAPLGGELFRAGSTYVWDDLQTTPTSAGRAEIEARLRLFLRVPFEVIDHQAAIRPVIDAGYPLLGRHPDHPALAYFNGLGSKGSLLAPFFADQLVSCLLGERQPDPQVDVRKVLRGGQ
jgi:glycine/D-amino acid oxidase-like deaminating enzyme